MTDKCQKRFGNKVTERTEGDKDCSGGGAVKFIFASVSFLALFLILKNSELAIDYMERGMKLCVASVIPSLFPFMVASELIVSSGAAEYIGRLFKKPFRSLFGVGGDGASVFLLGMVCGFPVGTRAALSLYKRKKITRGEFSRLICFSNVPSSAFVISAVGATLFGCRAFGIALYCITLLSAIIIGIILNVIYGDEEKEEKDAQKQTLTDKKALEKSGISSFSGAVISAANAMLGVCAFVVFFSVFTGLIGNALEGIGASQTVKAWLFSFFELTGGVAASAGVKPVSLAVIIAAFAVGWSGISVHFQVASFCDGVNVLLGRYILSKLLHGALNALLCWLYMRFFGSNFSFDVKSVAAFDVITGKTGELGILISSVFFSVILIAFFSWVKKMAKR
jgi:sporulation integral membrane protein YlbJ